MLDIGGHAGFHRKIVLNSNRAHHIRPYGEPLAFTPVELQTTAEGNTALFRVRFAAETLTWAVRVDPQGKINGFDLRRNARNHIFRFVTRLIEGW